MRSVNAGGPLRLTDQALVALALARTGVRGRDATVADLLVGLAEEPDGVAGRVLQGSEAVVVRLRTHPPSPRLPALEVALRWAAADVADRPLATADLLGATVQVGGAELADLLAAVGGAWVAGRAGDLPPRPGPGRSARLAAAWGDQLGAGTETLGLRPPTDPDPHLTVAAGRAVAHARAAGGGVLDLLLAVATSVSPDDPARDLLFPGEPPPAGLPDVDRLLAAAGRLPSDPPDPDLEPVVQAAIATTRSPATPADLLRAALLVGGPAVTTLLATARRPFPGQGLR